jgi:peptidoglycan/xylan/chitin deacetylase (PgdA/CDA1 family)
MSKSKFFRIVKTSYFFVISLLLAHLVNRPVVLCFHRIRKSSGSLLDQRIGVTEPDAFRKVINCLRILGYSFISLEQLKNIIAISQLKRVAVVTFDDGFKDLYQNAFPILKRLNIPFTLFLTTSTVESERLLWLHKLYIAIDRLCPTNRLKILRQYDNLGNTDDDLCDMIGKIIDSNNINVIEKMALTSNMANEAGLGKKEERLLAEELYLTKAELREMQRHGLSIEVHGHEHLPPANLNRTETENEIACSISYVMQEFNKKPQFFSLPYGVANQFIIDVVKDLKLSGITSTEQRLVKEFENTYRLPRICVTTDHMHFYRRFARCCGKAFLEKLHLVKSNC